MRISVGQTPATLPHGIPGGLNEYAAVEAFGAVGDGVTDDTAALNAAIASGRPLLFGPRTYCVSGQWTIAASVVMLGAPGQTTIKRLTQTGGAFIAFQGASFIAEGIIFDANGASIAVDSWGVLIQSACTYTDLLRCRFLNAFGPTLGYGLVIQASDPAICRHSIRACEFTGNTLDGIWVQAVRGVEVLGCISHDNGRYGINVDFNDPTFTQKVHVGTVLGCRAWNNQRGINIGNFDATNLVPATWGTANPDVISFSAVNNVVHDNTIYGIAASGTGLLISDNVLENNGATLNGAGILANVSDSTVRDNVVRGSSTFGIDAGGSVGADLTGNTVDGAFSTAINPGGSVNTRVRGNTLRNFANAAVQVQNVETDGNGNAFPTACVGLSIESNDIEISGTTALGVVVLDGAQCVLVAGNRFVGSGGAIAAQCLQASTDGVLIGGNLFNTLPRFTANPTELGGSNSLVFPDMADELLIGAASASVQAMLSSFQAASLGQVAFIKVTAGGSGYTTATVAIGGTGSGAAATALIFGGAVIGVMMTARGSGYGPLGTVVPVTISGNGSGATASAIAGIPVPDGRRLRIQCGVAVTFAYASSLPLQDNPSSADLAIAARSVVEWEGIAGAWRLGSAGGAGGGGGSYTLPAATGSTLGGVVVGGNISNSGGTISLTGANVTAALGLAPVSAAGAAAAAPVQSVAGRTGAVTLSHSDLTDWASATAAFTYTLPAATGSVLGGVVVGGNISNSGGTISLTGANVTAALGLTPVSAAGAAAAAPVQSVAGRTGAVTLTHSDITDWASSMGTGPVTGSAPTRVQATYLRNTGGATNNLVLGTAPTPGNLLVAMLSGYAGSGSQPTTLTGWKYQGEATATNNVCSVWTRVVQSGDGTTWNFTQSNNGLLALFEYSGWTSVSINTGNPVVGTNTQTSLAFGGGGQPYCDHLLMMENDSIVAFSVNTTLSPELVMLDAPADGNNHGAFIGSLPGSYTGVVTVNQSATPVNAVYAAVTIWGQIGAGTLGLPVSTTYTASGAIAVTDAISLVNAASAVTMTLGAGATDGHVLVVKRFGAGAVTLTGTIDGSSTTINMNSASVKEGAMLAWNAANSTWLLT
jgi:hypothetical protein